MLDGLYVKTLPAVQEIACKAGVLGLIPVLGRFHGEADGNPLQHSCPGNPMDRGV